MSCDQCEALMINGLYCHETGCPDAWESYARDCWECGCSFPPKDKYQGMCEECQEGEDPIVTKLDALVTELKGLLP